MGLKGIVHPKKTIQSLFTHTVWLQYVQQKKKKEFIQVWSLNYDRNFNFWVNYHSLSRTAT